MILNFIFSILLIFVINCVPCFFVIIVIKDTIFIIHFIICKAINFLKKKKPHWSNFKIVFVASVFVVTCYFCFFVCFYFCIVLSVALWFILFYTCSYYSKR